MTEIINFIKGKGKLVSPAIPLPPSTHPSASELTTLDILQFVKLFNNDVVIIENGNFIIRQRNIIHNGSQKFYLYNSPNGVVEKWEPSTWQHSTDFTLLYCGILAIIRPITSFEKTKELLRIIIDTPNSDGYKILTQIVEHFFTRSQSEL